MIPAEARGPIAQPFSAPLYSFDLIKHLERQRQFSFETFGPGARTKGVIDHIRKELIEIEARPHDLREWADLILLALDGAWRAGATPEGVAAAIRDKQAINEARTWPDWRACDPDKAIEHKRCASPAADVAAASGYDPRCCHRTVLQRCAGCPYDAPVQS